MNREALRAMPPFLEGLKPLLDEVARPRPGEPDTLTLARAGALRILLQEGLPDRTWESWRHSDPSAFWNRAMPAETARSFEMMSAPEGLLWSGPRSSPDLDAGNLAIFTLENRPLAALQVALGDNASIARVPRGVRPGKPLVLRHRSPASGCLGVPSFHLIMEEGSKLDLILEGEPGEEDALSLPALRVLLAKGACLNILERPAEAPSPCRIGLFEARLEAGAKLGGDFIFPTGRWVRQDLRVLLAGPGAEVSLRGLLLGREDRHLDLHTFIDHAAPSCVSRQTFRSVAADRATLVFNGEVLVREGAGGTDADQAHRNLLLSDEAAVISEPRLVIHHDDVRCTHGSATGPLDEEGVFYLRSRGIAEAEARRILRRAFVSEVFPPDHPLGRAAEKWLEGLEERP